MRTKITLLFVTVLTSLLWATSSFEAKPMLHVAVLDSGVDVTDPRIAPHLCKDIESRDFTESGLTDRIGHGTHVIGSIIKYAEDTNYCIFVYKVFDLEHNDTLPTIRAFRALRTLNNVDIINYSGGGEGSGERSEMDYLLKHPRVKLVVAAGNLGQNLGRFPYYPAFYAHEFPNVMVVGALHGKLCSVNSNYGSIVRYWEQGRIKSLLPGNRMGIMEGTSMACSVRTGKLIKELSQ